MVNSRFRKNIFEYHGISNIFELYLMASSLHANPGTEALCLNSVVPGHHIYKDIWSSVHDEELHCKREIVNVHYLYSVSAIKHINEYHGPPS